jgi:hypothetical protein
MNYDYTQGGLIPSNMKLTKEEIIDRWNNCINSNCLKTFSQMAMGRHDEIGDGWRTCFYEDYNIVLERYPSGYLIYDNYGNRFNLENAEDMCIEFNKKLAS